MTRRCRLRSATCLGLFALLPLAPASAEDKSPAAARPAKADDVKGRIDALLWEMTLEEKLGQLLLPLVRPPARGGADGRIPAVQLAAPRPGCCPLRDRGPGAALPESRGRGPAIEIVAPEGVYLGKIGLKRRLPMRTSAHGWCILAILLGVMGNCPAADEPPSRVQIGKIGKPATALVKARGDYCAAFCVHPSGLFITNAHVVAPPWTPGPKRRLPPMEINLILNPGLNMEKSYPARVVRSDNLLDLALLRVESADDLPALRLGSDEDLEEQMEVVALGFPGLITGRVYPSLSANAGSITSLRRKDGVLHRIQLDVVLNRPSDPHPVLHGGPVLDQGGKVVGVFASRLVQYRHYSSGVNFAIPASVVSRFIARPDIYFDPPELTPANVHKATPFVVRVTPLLPSSGAFNVELSLKAPGGQERTFAMKADGDRFRAHAVPVPPPSGPLPLRLLARFGDGAVSALITDQTFKVGDRQVKLSEVRSIAPGSPARVVLHDDATVEGALSGLDAAPVRLGGHTLTMNLSRAVEVKLAPAVETSVLWYTLRVRQGDREILRRSESLAIQGLLPTSAAPTLIKPPPLRADKVVYELSEPTSDVAVGGAGRYLVLRLPRAKKLAIFDVNVAKVVGHIPLAEEGALFTAGLEDVLVVLPGAGTIERWSLKSRERDVAATLPIQGVIKAVAMGSASQGPLLVHWAVGSEPADSAVFTFINPETMKVSLQEIKMPPAQMVGVFNHELVHIRASANGQVFGMWRAGHPSGAAIITVAPGVAGSHSKYSDEGHILPGPDGKTVFTRYGKRPLIEQMDATRTGNAVLPACSGGSYLELPQVNLKSVPPPGTPARPPGDMRYSAEVRRSEKDPPLATFSDLQLPQIIGEEFIKHDFTFDKRVHLIPEARLLITIPAASDRLVLRRYGG
jgi:hypothetical protein